MRNDILHSNSSDTFSFGDFVSPVLQATVDVSNGRSNSNSFCGITSRPGRQFPPPVGSNRTTMMLKNVPNKLTRAQLIRELETHLAPGSFDYVYVPIDFCTRHNYGYLFVNLTHPSLVRRFFVSFSGCRFSEVKSTKQCEVVYARVQGLQANVNRLINSPILSSYASTVAPDDSALPLVFFKGRTIFFPQLIQSASLRENNMLNWIPASVELGPYTPSSSSDLELVKDEGSEVTRFISGPKQIRSPVKPSLSLDCVSETSTEFDVMADEETERLFREMMSLLRGE